MGVAQQAPAPREVRSPNPDSPLVPRPSPLAPDLRGWEWRYLWALCRSDERFTLCQYSNAVDEVAFSPNGACLAVRRSRESLDLWDWPARRRIGELPNRGWRFAMSFSPRGNVLACGDQDENGKALVSFLLAVGYSNGTVEFCGYGGGVVGFADRYAYAVDGRVVVAGEDGLVIAELLPFFKSIRRSAQGMELSWEGFGPARLQRATRLTNPDWQDLAGFEAVNTATLPITTGPEFFRLIKP